MKKVGFEYKFTAVYLILGFLWIAFSDRFLGSFIADTHTITKIQTYKGWFYVLATALLFYIYLKHHLVKLRKAERAAKKSDELKTAFIQNMSHEIRTPMNSIVGFTELLNNNGLSEKKRANYIDIITKSSNQLLGIVNDVLEISMIETGNITPKYKPVKINDLLEDVYTTVAPSFSQNNSLVIVKGLPDNQCTVITDEIKLKQVIYNLLENANKFTRAGEISMGYTKEGNNIQFYVFDTGIGISQENTELIFDRFYKSGMDKPVFHHGVGLGLPICKGLLKNMGGHIWVESEVGKGSKFYFTIPYVLESDLQ